MTFTVFDLSRKTNQRTPLAPKPNFSRFAHKGLVRWVLGLQPPQPLKYIGLGLNPKPPKPVFYGIPWALPFNVIALPCTGSFHLMLWQSDFNAEVFRFQRFGSVLTIV